MTRKIVVMLPIACILAAGCSNQGQSGTSGSSAPNQQEEKQFVQEVGNLPVGQRQAYVRSHMDKLNQLKMDPDKTEMTQLNSLMPQLGAP